MRWSFVLPTLIVAILIAVFGIFFMDGIIKSVMVRTGEKVFEAKVEIGGLKTKVSNFSINISDIRVANKNAPMTNLFEIGSIRFAVKPLPLLSKKVVIDEIAAERFAFGTPRKTSGLLPPRRLAKIEREKKKEENKNSATAKIMAKIKEKASTEFKALPAVKDYAEAQDLVKNFSVEKLVNAADLQSVKEIEAMRTDVTKKYEQYDARINNLKVDEKINRAVAAANALQDTKIDNLDDLKKAQDKLNNLNTSKNELESALTEIQSLRTGLTIDIGSQKDLLTKVNALKDRDIQNLYAKMKLPSMNMGNLSRMIFGPVWLNRVSSVMGYVELARKYMPPRKKKDEKTVKKRLKGVDVSFPLETVYPDFLVRRIVVNGNTGGNHAIQFSGLVTNITSNQALLGAPTKFELNGVQGTMALALNGIFDHTTDVGIDSFNLNIKGLPAANFGIPQSDLLPSFDKGTVSFTSNLVLKGGNLDSALQATIAGFEPNASSAASGNQVNQIVAELWKGIPAIDVAAKYSGTPENLDLAVTSNIDQLLSQRMQALYGEKVTQLRAGMQSEIDKITSGQTTQLLADAASRNDELLKKLNLDQKDINDKLAIINSLKKGKGNAQTYIDGQKKKAEEELKKQATDQLKKWFH